MYVCINMYIDDINVVFFVVNFLWVRLGLACGTFSFEKLKEIPAKEFSKIILMNP